MFAHEDEPTEEADDEVFESDGGARSGETEECAELTWKSEEDEEDQEDRENLYTRARDGAEGLYLATIHGQALDDGVHPTAEVKTDQGNPDDSRKAQERAVNHIALIAADKIDPLFVNARKIFFGFDAKVIGGENFLIQGELLRLFEKVRACGRRCIPGSRLFIGVCRRRALGMMREIGHGGFQGVDFRLESVVLRNQSGCSAVRV